MNALSRLQDHVEPVSYDEIEKIVQDQLGVRISKAFGTFEKEPIGSASLGQFHRATLRNGREVAVKVQRPEIRKEIVTDLESLQEIADFLDEHTDFGKRYETGRILGEFCGSLMRELDYQKEARHLNELRNNLKEYDKLVIPHVVEDYSTSLVLTMDYMVGTKITSLSGAVLADIEGGALADELFRAYLRQILVNGFFHADPHPGNLLLTPDRFDPSAAIRRNLEMISTARVKDSFSIASFIGAVTETKDFLGAPPRRMNEILELVSINKLRVKVDSIDEHKLMVGLQKVANRITVGLILAVFIVASSMLARVETSFRIWGYPGLAMIFFIIAAVGAVFLMIQIFFQGRVSFLKYWHAGCYISFGDPTGTLRVNGFSLGLIGRVAFFYDRGAFPCAREMSFQSRTFLGLLLDELCREFLPLGGDGVAVIPPR